MARNGCNLAKRKSCQFFYWPVFTLKYVETCWSLSKLVQTFFFQVSIGHIILSTGWSNWGSCTARASWRIFFFFRCGCTGTGKREIFFKKLLPCTILHCSNWYKLVQNSQNLSNIVLFCQNLSKLVFYGFFHVFRYLLGTSSSQQGEAMEDHARQELLEEYFSSSGVGAPELEGFVWLKADNKKSWKKFPFVLRTSGLYYAPKGKKSSKDLVMNFFKLYCVGLNPLTKKLQNTKSRGSSAYAVCWDFGKTTM